MFYFAAMNQPPEPTRTQEIAPPRVVGKEPTEKAVSIHLKSSLLISTLCTAACQVADVSKSGPSPEVIATHLH